MILKQASFCKKPLMTITLKCTLKKKSFAFYNMSHLFSSILSFTTDE